MAKAKFEVGDIVEYVGHETEMCTPSMRGSVGVYLGENKEGMAAGADIEWIVSTDPSATSGLKNKGPWFFYNLKKL